MSNYSTNWPREVRQRIGGYTRTRTGVKFYVLDPRPDEVRVEDIAFSLSNTARWGGHCDFYSVAQHAVMCARAAMELMLPDVDPYAMLHHDDSEGYMTDLPRPIKKGIPEFKGVENNLMSTIGLALHFSWPMTGGAHALDDSMLIAESRILFPTTTYEDFPTDGTMEIKIAGSGWSPRFACERYLFMHHLLQPGK